MAKQAQILKKQVFRLEAPGAKKVLLAGDFTKWQEQAVPMRNEGNDIWTASVDLPPGQHHYLYVVDGEWREDPDCPMWAPNPYGGQNMVRVVV